MVVEDDAEIRESIADILQEEGYAVVVAADGAEALSLLRIGGAQRPSLILLDLMMPVMDGWAFAEAVRIDSELATIPMVALSGDAHVTAEAEALGCVAAIRKPISLDALLDLVTRFC
jgi:CheY-like chemotaxis protein